VSLRKSAQAVRVGAQGGDIFWTSSDGAKFVGNLV
jgi:hypothetical protein